MAVKSNVEEQVTQLTPQQQDKLLKVGNIALILELVGGIPLVIWMIVGLLKLLNPPAGIDFAEYDKVYQGVMLSVAVGMVYLLGVFVYIKVACPYFGDKKWLYIRKMRKHQRKNQV